MSGPVDVLAFISAAEVLPPISDDDCAVILQDWDVTDPDQRTAMRLAAEILRLRGQLRDRHLLICKFKEWLMCDVGAGHIEGDMRVYHLSGDALQSLLNDARSAIRSYQPFGGSA